MVGRTEGRVIRLFAFLLGDWVNRPYSFLIVTMLRLRGATVGRDFFIQGVPTSVAQRASRWLLVTG